MKPTKKKKLRRISTAPAGAEEIIEDIPKPPQPGTVPPSTPFDPDKPKKVLV